MSFLYPFILSAFIVLPALYYLLRITPPAPRIVTIPTARFLADLKPQDSDTHSTPWWILLLRLMMAALVILALSGPILNPEPSDIPSNEGRTIRIVIDNGWASAQTWDAQTNAAKAILEKAAQTRQSVLVLSTASQTEAETLRTPSQALSWLKSLEPQPWPADLKALSKQDYQDADTHWFGHGLDDGNAAALIQQFDAPLTYYAPPVDDTPVALKWVQETQSAKILRTYTNQKQASVVVQALDLDGQILDQQTLHDGHHQDITFDSADAAISDIRILGRSGIGGLYKLGASDGNKRIGVILPNTSGQDTPFLGAAYYLKRALGEIMQNADNIVFGTVASVMESRPDMIILPDTPNVPANDLNVLDAWINKGGLLLQFAGPNMAAAPPDQIAFSPVQVRSGGRSMGGELTWGTPQNLTPIPETSPLSSIRFHDTYSAIEIRRALLAEPEAGLNQKTWMSLSDGTPFITADPLGNGLSVLIHTTTTPEWSDFVLSGLYVEILDKLASLSGQNLSALTSVSSGTLSAAWVWDGWGKRIDAPTSLDAIKADGIDNIQLSKNIPPGLYKDQSGLSSRIINFGDTINSLKPLKIKNTILYDSQSHERSLMPILLIAALVLFMIDWVVMIGLSGFPRLNFKTAAVIMMAAICLAPPAFAQSPHTDLYLAYVVTGDIQTDAVSAQGLNALSTELNRRTSANPAGVIGININRDDIKPFPFLYWPMASTPQKLLPETRAKIQHYLNHGGTILFDTRGRSRTDHQSNLQDIMTGLSVPALHPIPEDHVLRKSFYLLSEFPGIYRDDTLWIEQNAQNGRDGVSSIIIGSHDWAGAWSAYNSGNPSRNTDLAMRFGINVTMYALTGNYKNDQLHVQEILKRMGKAQGGITQ
jgi:hypothetical protein